MPTFRFKTRLIKQQQGQMMKQVMPGLQNTALVSGVLLLAGCAATQTAIEHRNLETNTKLSKTIFLDPVPQAQKTIFIVVKNTSEETMDIAKPLAQSLSAQGYRVVSNPDQAHYLLQANILKVGKMSVSASQSGDGSFPLNTPINFYSSF